MWKAGGPSRKQTCGPDGKQVAWVESRWPGWKAIGLSVKQVARVERRWPR